MMLGKLQERNKTDMMHDNSITLSARAKINLYLDILSRRENGYHNILSIMQSVALCDTVTLTALPAGSGICIETNISSLPTDRRNLAYRAAEKFGEVIGYLPDVLIQITKQIPMSAGLAGGSADAAAVLRGLNLLCNTKLSQERLCELGATLGADIPFCIAGGAMITEGIGEILTPCDGLPEDQWLVIACGGEGVSTPDAYRALDEAHGNFAVPHAPDPRFALLKTALSAGDTATVGDNMYNIFEEIVLPSHSVAAKLIADMRASGAQSAMMSGSGPSVFGLFATKEMAEEAAQRIERTLGIRAYVTHPTPVQSNEV